MRRLTVSEILRLRFAAAQNDMLCTVLCKLTHYL